MILGEVFNPRDWKANTMGGLVCASISCRIESTNQCSKCSIYYCNEHITSYIHTDTLQDLQKEK